jgi:glyoxylase-like metal-dependent hydrolase (beta-lactamase superfamily II)
MNIKRFISKVLDENCYVLSLDDQCLIIDPGPGVKDDVDEYINKNNFDLQAVLLTHGHFDHTWDTLFFSNVPLYCHKSDKFFIENPLLEFDKGGLKSVINREIKRDDNELLIPTPLYFNINDFDSKSFKIGKFNIKAISLPGHSAGSTLYNIDNNMFCGDIIFANSYGRTDLYLSDPSKMSKTMSIITSLDGNLHFYPGHYNDFILKNWNT